MKEIIKEISLTGLQKLRDAIDYEIWHRESSTKEYKMKSLIGVSEKDLRLIKKTYRHQQTQAMNDAEHDMLQLEIDCIDEKMEDEGMNPVAVKLCRHNVFLNKCYTTGNTYPILCVTPNKFIIEDDNKKRKKISVYNTCKYWEFLYPEPKTA